MSTWNILKIDLLYTVITLVKCCHTFRKLNFFQHQCPILHANQFLVVLNCYIHIYGLCIVKWSKIYVQMKELLYKWKSKIFNLWQCSKQYISSLDELIWFVKHLSFTNQIILWLIEGNSKIYICFIWTSLIQNIVFKYYKTIF